MLTGMCTSVSSDINLILLRYHICPALDQPRGSSSSSSLAPLTSGLVGSRLIPDDAYEPSVVPGTLTLSQARTTIMLPARRKLQATCRICSERAGHAQYRKGTRFQSRTTTCNSNGRLTASDQTRGAIEACCQGVCIYCSGQKRAQRRSVPLA
jgi:hypothetical protein